MCEMDVVSEAKVGSNIAKKWQKLRLLTLEQIGIVMRYR